MSYQALARKWRPRTFADMVGQGHVRQALANALDADRLHHAFLFTGTRGVGKTTIARILAKCLNCEAGVGATPCGECSACREVDEGRFVDLIEVDAASRARVDETRELLDNVLYAPTRGRYKVYLIDEVHMFSKHSFNALLKTLEEPPPHVKFLLATTDPQRLPVTVLSRCLQFNLRRLPLEAIDTQLGKILTAEAVDSEPAAVREIARAADGSMRDALSLLDQAIAYGAGKIVEAEVRALLGTVERRLVVRLLEHLADEDAAALVASIDAMAQGAPDFEEVLGAVVTALGRLAILQAVPDAPEDDAESDGELRPLAERIAPAVVQLYYQIGLLGRRDLSLAPSPRSGFEMAMLRMLAFTPAGPGAGGEAAGSGGGVRGAPPPRSGATGARGRSAADTRPAVPTPPSPARSAPGGQATTRPARPGPATAGVDPVPPSTAPRFPRLESLTLLPTPAEWRSIAQALPAVGVARQLLLNTVPASFDGRVLELALSPSHSQLLGDATRGKLESALAEQFGAGIGVRIVLGEPGAETPAQANARTLAERQRKAVASIDSDPNVQAICERFDGRVDSDSVQPVGDAE